MKVGFVLNSIENEYPTYTSTVLEFTAHKMGHEVFLINIGDLLFITRMAKLAHLAKKLQRRILNQATHFLML